MAKPDILNPTSPEIARKNLVLPLMKTMFGKKMDGSTYSVDERKDARKKLNDEFHKDLPGYKNLAEVLLKMPKSDPIFFIARQYANLAVEGLESFKKGLQKDEIANATWTDKVDYVKKKFTLGSAIEGAELHILDEVFGETKAEVDDLGARPAPAPENKPTGDPNLDPDGFKNKDIARILRSANRRVRMVQPDGTGKDGLPEFLDKLFGDLAEVDDDTNEMERVSVYIADLMRKYPRTTGQGANGGSFDVNEFVDAQTQAQLETEKLVARRTFGNMVENFISEKNRVEVASLDGQLFVGNPSVIGIEGYKTPEELKRWKNILVTAAASLNFTKFKRGGAKPEEVYSMPGVGSAELENIRTNEFGEMMSTEPAFREAARKVFRGLFKRDDGLFPAGNIRSEYTSDGRYFIRAKREKTDSINSNEYIRDMNRIAGELVRDMKCDPNLAKIFVSMAGHVFVDASMAIDSADLDRKDNNRTPDPDRVLMHPLWKAIQKAGFQWFGSETAKEVDDKWNYNVIGKMGGLVQSLVALDRKQGVKTFTNKLLRGDWGYIPERTGASWTELSEVTVYLKKDGGKSVKKVMSVAEFLLEVNEKDIDTNHKTEIGVDPVTEEKMYRHDAIVFGRGGDDHLLGSDIRDWWPAMVLWGMAFKGKLSMKKAEMELPDFLEDWSNKMQDLRKIEIPGFNERYLAAHPERVRYLADHPGEQAVPESDMRYLLEPWLRGAKPIVGGLLNVINMPVLMVDSPILPEGLTNDGVALAARNIVESLTGLSKDEKQEVYDLLCAPNLTGISDIEASALFAADRLFGGQTDQAIKRRQLKKQSDENKGILNRK